MRATKIVSGQFTWAAAAAAVRGHVWCRNTSWHPSVIFNGYIFCISIKQRLARGPQTDMWSTRNCSRLLHSKVSSRRMRIQRTTKVVELTTSLFYIWCWRDNHFKRRGRGVTYANVELIPEDGNKRIFCVELTSYCSFQSNGVWPIFESTDQVRTKTRTYSVNHLLILCHLTTDDCAISWNGLTMQSRLYFCSNPMSNIYWLIWSSLEKISEGWKKRLVRCSYASSLWNVAKGEARQNKSIHEAANQQKWNRPHFNSIYSFYPSPTTAQHFTWHFLKSLISHFIVNRFKQRLH